MEITNSSGIKTTTCLYCNGVWITHDSLNKLLDKEKSSLNARDIKKTSKNNNLQTRKCPSCENENLNKIISNGLSLDTCLACNGIFIEESKMKTIFPTTSEPDKSYYGDLRIKSGDFGDGGGGCCGGD